MSELVPIPPSRRRWKLRLRLAGTAVLLAGTGGAILAYRMSTRYAEMMKDPSMAGFYKARTRQMGEMYGQMGVVAERFLDGLKDPGTQAKLILGCSILVAVICFHLARRVESVDPETGN
jgi:hypothetical protein